MLRINTLKTIVTEYGIPWTINRALYSAKLKMISTIHGTDKLFEKNTQFPRRVDLFQIDVDELKKFICNELNNDDKKMLIEAADKACEGIITGFNSIELNYGNPIDWQLNPLTGKRCSEQAKWYEIPDFDPVRGDIKVIWEASRFSSFISFARAYLLTDDEKYYKAFRVQLHDWLENNEYGYGANFKCGQECSLRMINALLAYSIFSKCSIVVPSNTADIKCLIDRCYNKILSNFFYAYKCIKNNHTISELVGMIIGAWCCEDESRIDKAYKMLNKVIDEQFTDDGGYRQFSFNYQRLALQDLEVILSIEGKTGKSLDENSKHKIQKAAELMYQCQDASGDMPNYGSNDGALVFPVTSCEYRDFRSVINTIYALTAGRQLYKNGIHQEELIWFMGEKKIEKYPHEEIKKISHQYPRAGLFTLCGKNNWAMIIANDYHSRPADMDQLHFDLWINGINVFCDAGTYSYASDIGRKLIKNESHNTVQVENTPQMNVYGPFMILDWTQRQLEKADQTLFSGTVHARTGYTHKRRVFLENNTYTITDTVNRDAFILFHTPFDVEIRNDTVIILNGNKKLCVLKTESTIELRESKRSLYYLKSENTSTIAIKAFANKELKTIIKVEGETTND